MVAIACRSSYGPQQQAAAFCRGQYIIRGGSRPRSTRSYNDGRAGKNAGESAVTQLEHAIQCATLAEREGPVAAARRRAAPRSRALETPTPRPCAAKTASTKPSPPTISRYLTATEADYAATLSRTSVLSLAAQGGPSSRRKRHGISRRCPAPSTRSACGAGTSAPRNLVRQSPRSTISAPASKKTSGDPHARDRHR